MEKNFRNWEEVSEIGKNFLLNWEGFLGLVKELGIGMFRKCLILKPGLERVRETSRPLCARQMLSPGEIIV